MYKARIFSWLLLPVLVLGLCGSVFAAQVDSDSTYCFSSGDFSEDELPLEGICVLSLPGEGAVMLGSRVIRPGDILTAEQVEQMTFSSLRTEEDAVAVVSYLPIYEDHVAPPAEMTISIRGKKDEAPVARDFALETYKNLPNEGRLKVSDPEGMALKYTVTRQPRRGTLELRDDGSFIYTPKKNKVGVDSFTYTAADPAGNVSREATVTVQILKPTASDRYTDTVGTDCRFEAEWLRNTGLFIGEQFGDSQCFYPEKAVTRGQFLATMMELLEIPLEGSDTVELPADLPQWLKPYYAAAHRAGLTEALPADDRANFRPEEAMDAETAAALLQSALDLPVATALVEQTQGQLTALDVLRENEISLEDGPVTRASLAKLFYRVSRIAPEAPGLAVYRLQG